MTVSVGGAARIRELVKLLSQPTSGGTKQLTVNSTAPVQLATEPTPVRTVVVKADDDNAGNVFVGFSDTVSTTNGFRLAAGQAIEIMIDDMSKIWAIADVDGQKIHVLWLA